MPDAPTQIVVMQGTRDEREEGSEPKQQAQAVHKHWQRTGRLRRQGQQNQDANFSPKLSRPRSSNALNKLREELLLLAKGELPDLQRSHSVVITVGHPAAP